MEKPDRITALHALAFLYLTFAKASDAYLDEREVKDIAQRLHDWDDEKPREQIDAVMGECRSWFESFPNDSARLDAARNLAESLRGLDDDVKEEILQDLVEISQQDGTLSADETDMLREIANKLGHDLR